MTLFLSSNFAMQSGLYHRESELPGPLGRRVQTVVGLYRAFALAGLLGFLLPIAPPLRAIALSLVVPGAGHLLWLSPGALLLTVVWSGLFGLSLIAWFGTGNVLAPIGAWLLAIVSAATAGFQLLADTALVGPDAGLVIVATLAVPLAVSAGWKRRAARAVDLCWQSPAQAKPLDASLSHEDGERLRLLLDRALQPVERFDGFEVRDQFQTAALRYQIHFVSYALSIVQANHMPAFQGYMVEAQRRLLAKQSNHRIWRYWALENAWGNLRFDADPVARENIMYSGFTGTQIALAESASGGRVIEDRLALDLTHPGGQRFIYTREQLNQCLVRQYTHADFGLLACEPNWVYPLCNAITATGLRAFDAQFGKTHWQAIAPHFRRALESEFLADDGSLVPFRSSLTGWAPPALGGAVMDAFPSMFLNALYPDIAEQLWGRLRARLATTHWPRAFWPIDVGNYGFSRASSYAASAAAAVEMGDAETAGRLLGLLDQECPAVSTCGVRHRPRASLWAHALEIVARHGKMNGLRSLVEQPAASRSGPFLTEAKYADVFVGAAHSSGGALHLVLHTVPGGVQTTLAFGGLIPERFYRLEGIADSTVRADRDGRAVLGLAVDGRADLRLRPLV